ncbi:hypothetical protein [Rhizobium leguminosarum]|uniref:hypothetical protein n=1 Tax=Rhizobium leguminosarum TaxID=384 RepID=UPI0010309F7A|nr:hypothetical protein [Rhizobium leguminosarum]QIJ40199.1 hypothetical protein G7039_08680 [Rhizobium leguminosarum]TBG20538.1 hypothetical protein ELG81_08205 [Rhizobium leguminosarum]TBG46454.1 hypothetical protein ELG75_08220 [Rhizobium leguminosarum]TBG79425.1 hypothetical protein ELG76_08555 [Rhizobium leguminosarum]
MPIFSFACTQDGSIEQILRDGEPLAGPVRLEQLYSIVRIYFELSESNLRQMTQQEDATRRRWFGLQSFLMSLTGLEAFTNTYFHLRGQEMGRTDVLARVSRREGTLSRKIQDLIELVFGTPVLDQERLIQQIFALSCLRNEIVHPRWTPSTLVVQTDTALVVEGLVENRQALFEDVRMCTEARLWCRLVVARIGQAAGNDDVHPFLFHWTGAYGMRSSDILDGLGIPR